MGVADALPEPLVMMSASGVMDGGRGQPGNLNAHQDRPLNTAGCNICWGAVANAARTESEEGAIALPPPPATASALAAAPLGMPEPPARDGVLSVAGPLPEPATDAAVRSCEDCSSFDMGTGVRSMCFFQYASRAFVGVTRGSVRIFWMCLITPRSRVPVPGATYYAAW